jgi:hypothetical protein
VLLSLLDQMDPSERALVRHLLRLDVLRREEELLGVEEEDAGLRARIDHRVGLLERDAERLLADDVLPRQRGFDRQPRVQSVRRRDRDHLDVGVAQHLAVIGVVPRDAVAARERLGIPRRRRGDGDDLGLLGHRLHRRRDAVGLEARADDPDLHLRHGALRPRRGP